DRRPPIWARVSVVWLIPLLALVISLFVAWQNYANRGVAIRITFQDAAGIDAGKTVIKFRDVDIGLVESIGFSSDIQTVIVTARVDKTVAPYLDEDAVFWVARPRVTTRGISEIDTIVSGVFIEGSWDSAAGDARTDFVGLEVAPLVRVGEPGTFFRLRAPDAGSLAAGAPILYKGIDVGQIESLQLADTGDHVVVDAFVRQPHDRRLTTATRFWNLSGFTLSLNTGGVELDVDSLASLVEGGIGFETVYSGGTPIRDGHVFELFANEASARESIFNRRLASEVRLSIAFDGSVQGLTAGAPVVFRGVAVGEVENLTATVIEDEDGTLSDVELLTNIIISPGRLGLPDTSTPEQTIDFLSDGVENGLRARIASANILTGALLVELVEEPEALPASLDRDAQPFPLLPSTESDIADFTASAEGVLERLNALPVEDLMFSAVSLMQSLERLASDEAAQGTPEAIVALLEDTRRLVNSSDVQAIPTDLRRGIAAINGLLDEINRGGAAATLLAALEETRAAAADINLATDQLPQLLQGLEDLTAKANALPVEAVLQDTQSLLRSTDTLVSSAEVAEIPKAVADLLEEARALIASDATQAVPVALQ
ncbi:MAG: MlaD family protein, partial [Pseudomonadota bacterium]